jgi:hypothetical protein
LSSTGAIHGKWGPKVSPPEAIAYAQTGSTRARSQLSQQTRVSGCAQRRMSGRIPPPACGETAPAADTRTFLLWINNKRANRKKRATHSVPAIK